MQAPSLNAIRIFEIVAKHLSFKEAAKELLVTPAAVTYQIKILESSLGIKLFVRRNRTIVLTPEAQTLLVSIRKGLNHIDEGLKKAREQNTSYILTVSAEPIFVIKWLAPKIYDFMQQFPNISIRAVASSSTIDLDNDNIDAVISCKQPIAKDLYSEKVTDDSIVWLSHPSLLYHQYPLNNLTNLKYHHLIYDSSLKDFKESPNWPECLKKVESIQKHIGKNLFFNQTDKAIQAAIDGQGLIFTNHVIAESDIDAGRLIVPFPHFEIPTEMPYYISCLWQKSEDQKIRSFFQWIQQQFYNPKKSAA